MSAACLQVPNNDREMATTLNVRQTIFLDKNIFSGLITEAPLHNPADICLVDYQVMCRAIFSF